MTTHSRSSLERGDTQGNGRHSASDLLLVLGVAAVVLGVVMMSRGVLPSPSAAHLVPPPHAVPGLVERRAPAPDEHSVAMMSPVDRVPATPRAATSSATGVIAVCPPRLDLDHDLRLVLAAMALQRRRTLHATSVVALPDTQEIPAKDRALARAKEAVARGEATPPAAGLSRGPGCSPGRCSSALSGASVQFAQCPFPFERAAVESDSEIRAHIRGYQPCFSSPLSPSGNGDYPNKSPPFSRFLPRTPLEEVGHVLRRADRGPLLGGKRGQAPPQLQRGLHPHRFGVTQTTDPRQLRHIQAIKSAQPAVVRQQPL